MRKNLPVLAFLLSASALVAALSPAHADEGTGGDGCPDTKATQVNAFETTSDEGETCGAGISLFGLRLSLFGPKCPSKRFTYPSHQTCNGEQSEGSYCAVVGMLPVTAESCACTTATILGTGALLPICECKDALNVGHVEDAQTFMCAGTGTG